jgi:hypothetical protein
MSAIAFPIGRTRVTPVLLLLALAAAPVALAGQAPRPAVLTLQPAQLVLDSPCGSRRNQPNAVSEQITVRNTGGRDLRILSSTISSGTQFFSITANQCRVGLTLGPAQNCRITVRFTPDGTANEKTGVLTVNSSVGSRTAPLRGRCRPQVSP